MSDLPLEKVTLFLYKEEFARLRELYPHNGASKIVRELVHAHIQRVEETARAKLKVAT